MSNHNLGNKITVEGKLFVLEEETDELKEVAIEVGEVDIYEILKRLHQENVKLSIEVLE